MEDNTIKEELFCLKYELDSLSELTIKNESERMLPNFCSELIEHDHRERYDLVCQYSRGLNVLDFACGVGYGSKMIAKYGNAKSVLGCDLSQDAIRYAQHRNKCDNLEFKVENAELYLKEEFYDLIVSFETIEHLPEPERFLDNVQRNLKKEGLFIVSTPISQFEIDIKPANPYHTQEWGFIEFQKKILQNFDIEKKYVQLYQNVFINEKIMEEHYYNAKKRSIIQKVKNKIKSKIGKGTDVPVLLNDWYNKENFTKIEEYTGQYDSQSLGRKYIGYQILICKKR